MKIVIFGSSGFLGTKLKKLFLKEGHDVIGTDLNGKDNFKIDATKIKDVEKIILQNKPDLVIDTIALTNSVECEKNPEKAKLLNYQTAKNILDSVKKINVPMFFISSSYVFDGEKGNYSEKDPPNPTNVYGKTKRMAEKGILEYEKGIVLRVDILYGFNGKEKPNGAFDMILSNNEIKLREPNQLRQPLFIEDVPKAILHLFRKKEKGIFHLAETEKVTIYEFLKSLEKVIRKESKIKFSDEIAPSIIKIPKTTTLDTLKIQKTGFKFTSFKKGLLEMKKQISSEQP
ncbi:MAG: SDR family oxidoreductase [Nanoarchaeota archaeon]|nr:SDR family oxidoreductase [Nanoarchaeota archaeon]